jgi:PAS domain S-box-containing protein
VVIFEVLFNLTGLCFTDAGGIAFHHDLRLVALSYLIAAAGSYAGLEMIERWQKARRDQALYWQLGSASVLGGTVWSMHFIGMLALEIELPVTYAPGTTLVSLLIAIGAISVGLQIVRAKASWVRICYAGIAVGLGIGAMHYIGMAGVRFSGGLAYTPGLWSLSLLVGIGAATAALWLSLTVQEHWQRVVAAFIMGGAICGMHYTGMAGTVIHVDPLALVTLGLPSGPLAAAVGMTTLALIVCALAFVAADRRVLASADPRGQPRGGRYASLGLVCVLAALLCCALWGAIASYRSGMAAALATEISNIFEEARYSIGSEESLERKYRLQPSQQVRTSHQAAATALVASLTKGAMIDTPADRLLIDDVLARHKKYLQAVDRMFAAVDAGDTAAVEAIDVNEADPAFDSVEASVDEAADRHGFEAADHLANLAVIQMRVLIATPIVFAVGVCLVILFLGVYRTSQRRVAEGLVREASVSRSSVASAKGDAETLRKSNAQLAQLNARLELGQVALQESEARLDRAQAIAGVGSWELDVLTGRYIWSKEMYHIRGVSPEDFEPDIDNVAAFVHPDDYPQVRRWLADLVIGGEEGAQETRVIRPDGEMRVLRVEGRAVTDPDGVIRHLAGTMQDITDRRFIERQLAQAQKMEAIGNLTGGMAHDFNNGLGVIIGNLDLLGRLIKTDQTAKELCDEARDGALRCADLIRLLLAFARRQPLLPQQTDVNALVESITKLLSRTLGEDITLALQLGTPLWPIVADPAQLEAALINLANNARDAMPRGGRLDITTKTAELDAHYAALYPEANPGEYVLIEVSDTGTGIAPEIVSRIFEPFFTTKEPGQGTGLGLSMVFGFVKQTGGHLSVYSEPGRGTTFRVYLPRAQASDAPAVAPTNNQQAVVGGAETVLVVEDNAPLRRATARQLKELGYQVREAEHAAAALEILSSGDWVDLLLTDVVMPGTMDGLDLAYQATRLRQGLKVLLTSGFPGVRGANQRITGCPFPLLNKPYGHDELARTLREILDRENERAPADADAAGDANQRIHDGDRTVTAEHV